MSRYVALAVALAAVGCAHKPEARTEATTPASAGTPASVPAVTGAPTGDKGGEKSCTVDLDCGSRQLCVRTHCVDITPDLAECGLLRVHFQFNKAEIDNNDKTTLQRVSRCLTGDHQLHVLVTGNADERGTDEYNMALGDQRATAVARYLEALGSSPTQLKTISYGKENPLCMDHDEECWSKNRRASVKPKAN